MARACATMGKKLLFAFALAALIASSAQAEATRPLPGPTMVTLGTTYSFSGRTGGTVARRAVGDVVLRGRWNHGAWATIARAKTDRQGAFSLSFVLGRRGTLDLRLLTPDGSVAVKTLQVS